MRNTLIASQVAGILPFFTSCYLHLGSEEDARRQARSYLYLFRDTGGYILCGSQSYIEDIPLESILAAYEENMIGSRYASLMTMLVDEGVNGMSQSTVMDQTKRIGLLREMALSKSHMSYVKRETLAATDEGRDTNTIVDRARDFEKYLQESVPFIQDWEIIVGGCSLIPTAESTINPGVADTVHNTPDYASVLRMCFGVIRENAQSLLK